MFSYTCGEQNRNENIAAELLCAVTPVHDTNVIEQKFPEKSAVYAMASVRLSVISWCSTWTAK